MKHCPKCGSNFPDTDQFCEQDGTTLVANNPDTSRKALIVLAVVVAAMAIGVALFVAYQRLRNQTVAESPSQSSSNQPFAQQVVSPPPPLLPSPTASVTPSPSPSPSPTPTPKPTPSVQAETSRVELSKSPVSTSVEASKRGPVTIRLTDGTTIKADEVWETGEGIWYRRRGVVTLLKRDQIKAIEIPKATPSPSPTSSPTPSP